MTKLTTAGRTQAMKAALRKVLNSKMRKLGFSGSLPWFRRLTNKKADILHVQFSVHAFRLDAGQIPLAQNHKARTIRQDWVVYTTPTHPTGVKRNTLGKVARHRPGADFFFFDTGSTSKYFTSVAESAANIVASRGVNFWKRN